VELLFAGAAMTLSGKFVVCANLERKYEDCNMDNREKLIKLLKDNQIIKFGKFRLSSGGESHYYVDMKKAITNPLILGQIAEIISERIVDSEVDKVAGPALGAIPIVTAISLKSQIPMLMIRPSKKDYGTSKQIEGEIKEGDAVVVVEDVTTTGNSLLKAIEAILENGGQIKKAFVVVDRSEGALENLKEKGIILEPLVSVQDFGEI
jgi:orotate phosphoribosyltransferase